MANKFFRLKKLNMLMAVIPMTLLLLSGQKVLSAEDETTKVGGGYAISGQTP